MTEDNALFSPDFSLIHRYNKDDELASRSRPTAVTHFARGGKNLYYINASHVTDTNNPTCKTIEETIKRYKPQAIVIESVATKGFSKDTKTSETTYAYSLAKANNIDLVAGEPPDSVVLDAMMAKGYSAKDVMAFYLLRRLPQDRREGTVFDDDSFAKNAELWLNRCFPDYPGEKITVTEFKGWYDKHKVNNKSFLDIEVSDVAPDASPDAAYFQKIASDTVTIRDTHTVGKIADTMKTHDNVLVVYGGAHLTDLRPVLEQMFTHKGETIQLAPDYKKNQENKKKSLFTTVTAIAIGAVAAVAAGFAADKFLNEGRAAKKIFDTVRGWGKH